MTASSNDDIRAAPEAATPGPWFVEWQESDDCAACGIPRADHGWTSVADRDGKPGPWHHYQAPTGCASCRAGNHHSCNGLDGPTTTHPDSLPRCACLHQAPTRKDQQ